MGSLSGLAATFRGAADSETFDLAGKKATTIDHAILDAFKDPFPLRETIRLTFVTGAGKLARQKYDEGAAKSITNNLRNLGYVEDHGGGAGSYKLQHDTGKNLKTVVVYPKVIGKDCMIEEEEGTTPIQNRGSASLLVDGSAEQKIAMSSMNIFERMITSMCPTWTQKKGCVTAIDQIKDIVKALDEKLLLGRPLDVSEQDFYDAVSISSLEEKQALVREMMHSQVDNGQITAAEREQLMDQVNERLVKLETEKTEAEQETKTKRVENMVGMIEKALQRKEKLANVQPRALPILKKQTEINKLLTELAPLLKLQQSAKGRLLSLTETQAMARKEEIDDEIRVLEVNYVDYFFFCPPLTSLITIGSKSRLV